MRWPLFVLGMIILATVIATIGEVQQLWTTPLTRSFHRIGREISYKSGISPSQLRLRSVPFARLTQQETQRYWTEVGKAVIEAERYASGSDVNFVLSPREQEDAPQPTRTTLRTLSEWKIVAHRGAQGAEVLSAEDSEWIMLEQFGHDDVNTWSTSFSARGRRSELSNSTDLRRGVVRCVRSGVWTCAVSYEPA